MTRPQDVCLLSAWSEVWRFSCEVTTDINRCPGSVSNLVRRTFRQGEARGHVSGTEWLTVLAEYGRRLEPLTSSGRHNTSSASG